MKDANRSTVHQDIQNLAERYAAILSGGFVGFYLHGSLAMGCFNEAKSDIDFLVVVRRSLTRANKRQIVDLLLAEYRRNATNPIEMSVLLLSQARFFQHPTPFELHFSGDHLDRYASDSRYFCENGNDPDLAAHIVVLKKFGKCVMGEPVEQVFGEVPREAFLDAIIRDSLGNTENILKGEDSGSCAVPTYGVLNLCRVLAFIRDGAILSKAEGGEWGFAKLPDWSSHIIRQAYNSYTDARPEENVDCRALKRFAEYGRQAMQSVINQGHLDGFRNRGDRSMNKAAAA